MQLMWIPLEATTFRDGIVTGTHESPPLFLDHRAAPPQAWCFTPLYTLTRGPVSGAHFRFRINLDFS